MGQFGVGQSVLRKEDVRFISGSGQFTDDLKNPDSLVAIFLRSPEPHARITSLDVSAARAMDGVHAVLTGDDVSAEGAKDLPCMVLVKNRDGSKQQDCPRPLLAGSMVRYVGEPIVCVIAETPAIGKDALDLIDIDYESLPASTSTGGTVETDAPQIHEKFPGNIAFDWEDGNPEKTAELMAQAHRVIELDLINNRVIANSMEARCARGTYDTDTGNYVLHTPCQGVHSMQGYLGTALGIEKDKLRVVCPDVGGGFGMKLFGYPEQALVLMAAKITGREVHWTADRSETMLADVHGRDHVAKARLAVDADGKFLALHADVLANMGAYLSQFAPFIPTDCGSTMYNGPYDFQAVHFRSRGVYTNTVPVDAYRGAGRPEATYLLERIVDQAARELGMDSVELRKRNFIQPSQMPYVSAMGATYDSGEFARIIDKAMINADRTGFAARQTASEAEDKLRGFGICYYIEQCGGGGGTEFSEVSIRPDGKIVLTIGTQNNGQGHETAFAQVLCDKLGVDFDDIELNQGDTSTVAQGNGTGGSRSLPTGGPAVQAAADNMIERARAHAAGQLEAAETDLTFSDGKFTIVGTDRSIGLMELASRVGEALDGAGEFKNPVHTFPNGCHIAEVEVDPETGNVRVDRYTVVDDFGVLLNPMLVAGQVHGGVVQGMGQALMEDAHYDHESGQLLAGSFMDYAMPRADLMPEMSISFEEVPCVGNPLGIKGCGEAGAIASPAAVINGIIDAARHHGVNSIDMPATPATVWQVLNAANIPLAAE